MRSETSQPLVSCIMPTYNRREFVPHAIRYFLHQDFAKKELIIIDDGSDTVKDLVPDDERIRYLRPDKKHTIGAKRNLACKEAAGDIIVHWDDDDWMAPHRITYQVENLLKEQADVCGLDQLYFYDPLRHKAWHYAYPKEWKPWLAGGTLCYKKNFWHRNPFPDINVGEDARFVWSNLSKKITALRDSTFYVALIHEGNTSPKQSNDRCWHAYPLEKIRHFMGEDWNFYSQQLNQLNQKKTDKAKQEVSAIILGTEITQDSQKQKKEKPYNDKNHITVSMPYFGSKQYICRAVESVLAQSHTNLTLVVVNDGDKAPPWNELAHIDDQRLVRFDLPTNHGPFFIHEMIRRATNAPYLFIHDSDDWSDLQLFSTLLRQLRMEHAGGAITAHRCHYLEDNKTTKVDRYDELRIPLTTTLKHLANQPGLYKTSALQAIGGYYGGFRMGYDTLIINLLLMTNRLAYVEKPLYHRLIHANSLTTSPSSGMKSLARGKVVQRLRQIYSKVFSNYTLYLEGNMDHQELCKKVQDICHQEVKSENEQALQEESQRLGHILETHQNPAQTRSGSLTRQSECYWKLIDSPQLPWDNWSISKPFALHLQAHLEKNHPQCILEVGSGISTLIMADYARRYGATLLSLEHEEQYYKRTKELLHLFNLNSHVKLQLAPLRPRLCNNGKNYQWYSIELKWTFDFVFVDGPPQSYGREATLFAAAPHLAKHWELWLHNAKRSHEQHIVELWSKYFRFKKKISTTSDPRGVFYLSNRGESISRLLLSDSPMVNWGN